MTAPPELGVLAGRYAVGSYDELLCSARAAEEAGLDAFYRSDHHISLDRDRSRPITEAWTTLAGLARETERIRIGILISPILFRHPVLLARMAASVDAMSGGRLEVGLGLGGFADDLELMGVEPPAPRERIEMLDEYVQVLQGLWAEPPANLDGTHFELHEARIEPKPAQRPGVPLIIGGKGKPALVRLCARHGVELNLDFPSVERCAEVKRALAEAAAEAGTEPPRLSAEIEWPGGDSAAQDELICAYGEAGVDRVVLFLPAEHPAPELIADFASNHQAVIRKEPN